MANMTMQHRRPRKFGSGPAGWILSRFAAQTFDVRTYRLCRRVFMFHHFPEELDGALTISFGRPTSTTSRAPSPHLSLRSRKPATRNSRTEAIFSKALPKLEFKYAEIHVDETVRDIDPASIRKFATGRRRYPVPMDRSRQRGIERGPHRTGRRLVLQAQSRQRHLRLARAC